MAQIAIIEDDFDILKVYSEKLKSEGFKFELANNATDGLELIRNKKPQLILLDIMLPGNMNGFDLLEQLKADEKTRAIPVIIMTNIDTERQTAKEIGAVEYLLKANTTPAQLVEVVKKYL